MPLPDLSVTAWVFATIAAFCIGVSKSGFPGISMVNVLLMAKVFPARESTGVVLPLLILGDVLAVLMLRRHADWHHIRRTLPLALLGVVVGFLLMLVVQDAAFRVLIGSVVLVMAVLQAMNRLWPRVFEPHLHSRSFAALMGATSGVATMTANAAGPVMTLYLLAVKLPKLAFAGTSAWFFLVINVFKVPFSWHLDLIGGGSLAIDLVLAPAVVVGLLAGRRLVEWIPQRPFELLLLALTMAFSLHFLGLF